MEQGIPDHQAQAPVSGQSSAGSTAQQAPTRASSRSRAAARKKRFLTLGLPILIVMALLLGVGGFFVWQQLDHADAKSSYEAAQEDVLTAIQRDKDAVSSREAAKNRLAEAVLNAEQVLQVSDESLVDQPSLTALAELHGAMEREYEPLLRTYATDGPFSETLGETPLRRPASVPESVGVENPSTEQYRDWTAQLQEWAAGYNQSAETHETEATGYLGSAEELGISVQHLYQETGAQAAALLTEHTGASETAKARITAAATALTTAGVGAEASLLADYIAAAKNLRTSAAVEAFKARINGSDPGSIDDPNAINVVSNKKRPLNPVSHVPRDLVRATGLNNPSNLQLRAEAARALEVMSQDAQAAGITLFLHSAYRSYDRQYTLYHGYVASRGQAWADGQSARPGHSEHQLGLAADLGSVGEGCGVLECFKDTRGGKWLAANAYKYGYILRYPNGERATVGFDFEPWHYRYVGVDVSYDMHNRGIINLEDYYELPAAPTY